MDETPSNVVEELLKDAVGEQRKRGIPRPNDAKRYITGIVEKSDRRMAETKDKIQPKPRQEFTRERSSADLEAEYQRRCKRFGVTPAEGSWTVEKNKPEPSKVMRPASLADQTSFEGKRRALQERRLRVRLRLLRGIPEWADKIRAVNPLALQGQLGVEKQKHAEEIVRQVIRDSDRVFGPWMKGPKKKLTFDQGAKR